MPTYAYTTPASPQPVHVTADNLPAAIQSLLDQGVTVTSIGEPRPDLVGDARLSEWELCILLRQLAAMLESGTPLVEALRLLANETRSRRLRRVLSAVAEDVADGIPLSTAMASRPRAFGPIVVALVRAGEAGAGVEETLRQIADHREGFARLVRRTASLLVYPAAVCTFGFAIVSFLLTFILPRWMQLYNELGVTRLPAPTRLVQLLASGLPWFALALIASLTAAVITYCIGRRTVRGRLVLDYWRLGVPIAGRINLNLALARISGALSMLLRRGVPIVPALRLAGAASGNAVIATAFRRGERAVSEGRPLADGLREAQVLPESFVWRVGVSESSGDIADALERMSRFYVQASQTAGRAAQGLLEPILVVMLGLLVMCIVLGMFMPLIGIIAELSGV